MLSTSISRKPRTEDIYRHDRRRIQDKISLPAAVIQQQEMYKSPMNVRSELGTFLRETEDVQDKTVSVNNPLCGGWKNVPLYFIDISCNLMPY